MSQNVPPQLEGHIDAPNPLELFWEKNKRVVTFGLMAAAIAAVINYFLQYQARRATAEKWSALAVASGLDHGYAEPGKMLEFIQQQNDNRFLGFYVQQTRADLAMAMDEAVKSADVAGLEQIASGDDVRAPLALWVLANKTYLEQDFAGARTRLETLKSDHPDHFLCVESAYPVQWRDEVPKPEGEEEDEQPKRAEEKPELVPAKPGSAVGVLLACIEREETFRAEHPRFYQPKEPTSPQTVTFDFEGAGTVKIRFFSDLAPKHVARFLELAGEDEGWWKGQCVHEIRRAPEASAFASTSPNELVFGWSSTTSDDRTTWKAGDVAEENLLDWENTDVSHFPGTVAVEVATEGKSQVERVVITGQDVSAQTDGTRVVIGRVIEGLDVVRDIIDGDFADDAARQSGRGIPGESYTIRAITIE